MKKLLKLLFWIFISALCSWTLTHCKPETNEPLGASQTELRQAAHSGNNGNHFGNFINSQDSAEAIQNWFQFPPIFDRITYPTPLYNTWGTTYDSVLSEYTITQTGVYTIEASCYRDLGGGTSDLQLSVNGITVYDTGLLTSYPITFTTNILLHNNDIIYIRTSTWHGVLPNGTFKILR